MARETKLQREARELQDAQARHQREVETYPTRLMETLGRACATHEFTLTVVDSVFWVARFNTGTVFKLSHCYTGLSDSHLADLAWEVRDVELEQEEAERKATLKNAALAKLSAEEREVLGLPSTNW